MIINKDSLNKVLSNNILTLSQGAAKAKALNPNVINATIGMLNNSNGSFYTFATVEEVMKTISNYEAFSYADTSGGSEYKKAILKWVFGAYLETFTTDYHVGLVATPGGSGAIATTVENYLRPNGKLLVPSVMWETYITIAKERGCDVLRYDLYDDGGIFNLSSIRKSLLELKNQQQESIVLVINDPCHNPTGFCMSDENYDDLVALLNSINHPIVLLMDIAYFDFYDADPNVIRCRYSKLAKLNDNILINFAFSGSKTFGLYGLRIGANILFSKNKEEVTAFEDAISYTSRSNWGSCSRLGISIINKLVLNDQYLVSFQREVEKVAIMLEARSKAFIEEANAIGLEMLPYNRGFFVCVPSKDPVLLMNKLHEYGVYVVVTKTCIRIALCAINEEEAKALPKIILKAKQTLEG